MRAAKLLLIVSLAFIVADCLPKTRQLVKTLWEKGDSFVALVEFKDDPLAPYAHPSEMDTKLVARALGTLKYQQIAFFKWGKPKPVFKEEEVQLLSGYIASALAEATDAQLVNFCLRGRRTELIFPKSVLTCGLVFARDDRLHIVFSPLLVAEDELEEATDGIPTDPRRRYELKQRRIFAEPPVLYPPRDEGNPLLKKPHTNWAVVDVKRLGEAEAGSDIEARLKKLKELFEKGLITEEEYEQKKKEILEDL